MESFIVHLLVFHAVGPTSARTRGPGTAFNPPGRPGQYPDHTALPADLEHVSYGPVLWR